MQRTLLLLVAVLTIVAAVPGIALATRPAAVVRVPANADPGVAWVSTGVIVSAGETLSIRANGQAITGPLRDFPDARSGPAGQITHCVDDAVPGPPPPPCALSGEPYGALLAELGGNAYLIGASDTFTVPSTVPVGTELRLAINDNKGFYFDNRGNFSVQIRRSP